MKKLFAAIVLLLTAVVSSASADGIFEYVPADSRVVINVDASALLTRPAVSEVLNSKEAMAKQLKFSEIAGCDIKDLQKAVVAAGDTGKGVVIFSLSKKIDVPAALKKSGVIFTPEQVGGKTIYARDKRSAVCQMADNVVIFGAPDDLKALINGKCGIPADLSGYLSGQKGTSPVWAAFTADNLRGFASLNFAGKEQTDILFAANIEVSRAEDVPQVAAMVQMYAAMFSGIAFSGAPELGEKMVKSLQVNTQGKTITLSLLIPAALAEEVAGYVNECGRKAAEADSKASAK